MFALINDWQTWVVAKSTCAFPQSLKIISESPGVYEALRKGSTPVIDASRHVSLEAADTLGKDVVALSHTWRSIIDTKFSDAAEGLSMGAILHRSLPQFLFACCYHHMLLKTLVSQGYSPITVPFRRSITLDSKENRYITRLCEYTMNFFGLMAQVDSMDGALSPLPLKEDETSGIDKQSMLPSQAHVPMGTADALRHLLLKFSAMRPSSFQYLLLKATTSPNLNKLLRLWTASRRHVFYFLPNDISLRLISRLLIRRVPLTRVTLPSLPQPSEPGPDIPDVVDALRDAIPDPALAAPLGFAAQRVSDHLRRYLIPALPCMRKHANTLLSEVPEGKIRHFWSNSLGGSLEILMSNIFRQAGVPVTCFQHGEIGLLSFYETMNPFLDMAHSDFHVCYNAHGPKFYAQRAIDNVPECYVQGVRKELQPPFPRLARRLGRKIWRLSARPALLYAPARYRESVVWPQDIYDMKYWNFMKLLVSKVLGKSSFDCVIKVHQKGLWNRKVRQLYKKRKNPLEEIHLPTNVTLRYTPQLNFSRTATDLLLIDRATSTLGWALGVDVPLIYINLPMCPLHPHIMEAMGQALFLVDGTAPDWISRLRALLDTPPEKRSSLWEEKTPARSAFIEAFVSGPSQGKGQLFNWLMAQGKA